MLRNLKGKHLFAKNSESSKRKKSSEGEERDNKREKTDPTTSTDTTSIDSFKSVFEDPQTDAKVDLEVRVDNKPVMAEMSDEVFTNKMLKAFSDKRMQDIINGKTNEILDRMDNRLTTVEEKITLTEAKTDSAIGEIDTLKNRIDDLEQKARSANLIIAGEFDTFDKHEMVKVLNENLGMDLTDDDIKYTLKMGKDDGKKIKRIRMVFANEDIREKVVKARKKLKGKKIYLTDDLTPQRNTLAYHARMAVKNHKLADTWVYDGKVFGKTSAKGAVRKINNISEIPE